LCRRLTVRRPSARLSTRVLEIKGGGGGDTATSATGEAYVVEGFEEKYEV
jgi:hypothetical protein